jgi:hypothetical protein
MAHDETAVERVRRILAGRPDVLEKRMVGGRSFMVGGHLCCGVTGTAVMVRVGPERHEWALSQPHVRPMAFAGRHLGGYVCVDPAGYASDTALQTWIRRGIDYVSTLPTRETERVARPARTADGA